MTDQQKHRRFQIIDMRDKEVLASFDDRKEWALWYEQNPNIFHIAIDVEDTADQAEKGIEL